jgi:cobalt-zinc-cadmium efflux system protein
LHAHGQNANERAVGLAVLLTGGFMVVEVIGGIAAGSLALIADAGHMLTDCAALTMAWVAFRVARRAADKQRTFGFDRVSVLVAFVNGLALFAIAGWIAVEAVTRLAAPQPVAGGLMLGVAVAGLAVNAAAFWILSRGERSNLNLRAALLHVVGDLLGSVAAIAAALVILGSGWTPIDPILSVLVAIIILRSGWQVMRDSAHILLEAAPAQFDPDAIAADLRGAVPGIAGVQHLHAWSISQERPMVTLEALIDAGADAEAARSAIKARLHARFGFDHATVEIVRGGALAASQLPCPVARPI